jgi:hypothetical protein
MAASELNATTAGISTTGGDADQLILKTGGTAALTFDASQNATFAGSVTATGGFVGGGDFSTVSVISTATNAASGTLYVLTADLTLTLPITPSVGDVVGVSNLSGVLTCVIARNGEEIMNVAEDLTVNLANAGFTLIYSGSGEGWVIL